MIGIRRGSPRQAAMTALAQAGGSMEYDDFRRALAALYPEKNGAFVSISQMRRLGLIQFRVQLTATGSARLSKTLP